MAAGEGDALLRLTDQIAGSGDGLISWDAALSVARLARVRNEHPVAILRAPPLDIASEDQERCRRLGGFLQAWSVTRDAEEGHEQSWALLAAYLFGEPYGAARPLIRAGARAALEGLSTLLATARAYDRTPKSCRETNLAAQVRLLLAAGERIGGDIPFETGEGVRVLTVHSAKGLEWPVVFVPNLAKGRFPGRGQTGMAPTAGVLDISDEAARAADARCLFFVAISRARDRLILSRAERYEGKVIGVNPLLDLTQDAFECEPPERAGWRGSTPAARVPAGEEEGSALEAQPAAVDLPEIDHYALETYLACPRRYYYGEVLGLQGSPGTGFVHFHHTHRRALARIDSEAIRDARTAEAILEQEWAAPHAPHPQEASFRRRAGVAVSRMFGAEQGARDRCSHVVVSLVRPHGIVRVTLDQVETGPDGMPVAVRLHTGRPTDRHRRDWRAALYQEAIRALHGQGRVRRQYLLHGTIDEEEARPSTLARRLEECDRGLAGIAANRFAPSPDDECPTCPFWLICPGMPSSPP